ncbi:MAG: hypothetical protein KA508_00340 [Gammaproteobacteria bacterium]|nr:hypothetical protein [Gammaproteobacteria bacterium]
MADLSLTWAFRMQPLKRKWAEVFSSKDSVQHEKALGLAAMFDLPDFKSEHRSSLFKMIDHELGNADELLKHPLKPKV